MKRYGYIRVSTKEQNPERQVLAMRAQEIEQKIGRASCRERV